MACGWAAGGSCVCSASCSSFSVSITACISFQNLSATESVSFKAEPRFEVVFCRSPQRAFSLSSFFLISRTAGSDWFVALEITSLAARCTAANASLRLSISCTSAKFSSI
uniref:Putative secreted protein n=1 Tax=Anopheles darlingi TaxID=43151 RepID=A0A2M4D079_ANODA